MEENSNYIIKAEKFKQDGKSKVLLYAYGAYKHSIDATFSASRFCLVDRGLILGIAHVRGGGDVADFWHEEENKCVKNTFFDYISCANHLIDQKYTIKVYLFLRGVGGWLNRWSGFKPSARVIFLCFAFGSFCRHYDNHAE